MVVEGEGGGGEGKGMPGVDDRKEARTWAGWGSAAAAAEVVAAARLKLGILVSEGRCTHRLRVAVSRTVSWRARVTVGRHAIRAIPRHARTPTPRLTLTAGAVCVTTAKLAAGMPRINTGVYKYKYTLVFFNKS